MADAIPGSETGAKPKRYVAFISYSHTDRKWAEWLHRSIETYRIPPALLAELQSDGAPAPALRPVFLDRSELPSSSDLAASIQTALDESAFLIVVCSPDSARSRWVNEEVRTFKALGREARILCLIVAGSDELSAPGGARREEFFPEALRFKLDAAGQVTSLAAPEPLAADVRPRKDDRHSAKLKIIAGLLNVPYDRLRQREHSRRQRRLAAIATAAVIGCVAFGVLAAAALLARNEADRQRVLAEQHALTARRTADFLKSLFVVSNPSEARGNTVTAREVLDRGVRLVGEQLKGEPLVRADLTMTLGDVYTNLGLLKQGEDLLREARSIPSQPDELRAREALSLGEVQYQRGDNVAAQASLDEALALANRSAARDPLVRARVHVAMGDLLVSTGEYDKARQLIRQALTAASGSTPEEKEITAHAQESLAQADFYDNRLDEAAAEFKTALAARNALSGDLHPAAIEMTDALGSVEYMRGNLAAASGYYHTSLAAERKVLGEHDPEIGTTLNNLGRVLLEQRKFAEARALLDEALGLQLSQRVDTDAKAVVFIFANLALADVGLGRLAEAEPLFLKGLSSAIANKHRLQGPILTDLADLECRTGRIEQGLARLTEARPLVIESYPDDPWRPAHVDNVRAGCLTAARKYPEAAALIESSDPIVFKKWPGGTLYGYDALQRTTRLYTALGDTDKLAVFQRMAARK